MVSYLRSDLLTHHITFRLHFFLLLLLPNTIKVNSISLFIAAYQAWQARNIKSEFSEAKYIGFAIFSMCQAFLTGLPIVAITDDKPRTFYIVLATEIFIFCMILLLLIFLPKVVLQQKYSKATPEEQRQMLCVSIERSSRKTLTFRSKHADVAVRGSYSDEFANEVKLEVHESPSNVKRNNSEHTPLSKATSSEHTSVLMIGVGMASANSHSRNITGKSVIFSDVQVPVYPGTIDIDNMQGNV